MKKGVPFEWDEACRNAFKSIKYCLMKSHVLVAPGLGLPLILYITAQVCSVGALLAQENDEEKESALYYLKWELSNDFPDENILVIEVTPPWKMYFDGAPRAGTGVIFIRSDGEVLSYSFTLTRNCSNNVVEYQVLILGLKVALDIIVAS
ncbi:UNVERIFIED_CONTAM: hypothetical protein Sindi_1320500 [Sesamum indicum]